MKKKKLIPKPPVEQPKVVTSWGYSFQNGGEVPSFEKGGKLQNGVMLYQGGGNFRALSGQTEFTEGENKFKFIPGTYDTADTEMANQYAGIQSKGQFGASQPQAQSKIDYTSKYGARTASGMAGARGKTGVDMTNRLAQERQTLMEALQKDPSSAYKQYSKQVFKGKDGQTYIKDSTGQYTIGKLEMEPSKEGSSDFKATIVRLGQDNFDVTFQGTLNGKMVNIKGGIASDDLNKVFSALPKGRNTTSELSGEPASSLYNLIGNNLTQGETAQGTNTPLSTTEAVAKNLNAGAIDIIQAIDRSGLRLPKSKELIDYVVSLIKSTTGHVHTNEEKQKIITQYRKTIQDAINSLKSTGTINVSSPAASMKFGGSLFKK